jgi:radical SAM protein with 4Fe4S-binding SPASM domain
VIAGLVRAAQLSAYPAFRATGIPRLRPINLTVSVTYACSSRCRTCDVWRKRAEDLRLEEYERVFRSLGRSVAWVTVSGGDQFLRKDLPQIVGLIRAQLEPSVINLPMNGLLTRRIEELLPEIARQSAGSQLVLNLSVDDLGESHDAIRGHRQSFANVMRAFRFARELQRSYRHVVVGIHTVISKLNVERIAEISRELLALDPDSYICEVAENRVELGTMEKDITPSAEQFAPVARLLQERIRQRPAANPTARLVQALRLQYYNLVGAILREQRQVIPCYAGWASAHIAPDGDVWGCCVRAEPMGNLRQEGFDFDRVWMSERAERFRRSVRARECVCPLASACYTNLMLSPATMPALVRNYFRLSF